MRPHSIQLHGSYKTGNFEVLGYRLLPIRPQTCMRGIQDSGEEGGRRQEEEIAADIHGPRGLTDCRIL